MDYESKRDNLVASSWANHSLGELIRSARIEAPPGARHSQGELAGKLTLGAGTIGAIERGSRVPGLELLARLASTLEPDPGAQAVLLTRWLAKWLEQKAAAMDTASRERPVLVEAAARVVQALAAPSGRVLPPPSPRSLEAFPERFEPLVGVFPDRREVPPESPGDLFIRGGAVTDYQYLPLLQGMRQPLAVCSDKIFVLMPEDWLRERFGATNLLVVGSSGVNWLTRRLAGSALFRPLIDEKWRRWDRDYRELSELDDDRLLGPFWRLVDHAQHVGAAGIDPSAISQDQLGPDEAERLPRAAELANHVLGGATESEIVQHFRLPGFSDPADGKVHGQLPGQHIDFGVISLAPHPFDPDGPYLAIICAGISGPGTAHALKALFTQPHLFKHRPFGGVIRVTLPARVDWPGRFEKAVPRWQTEPYKPEAIEGNLRRARATQSPRDRAAAFQHWSDDELDNAITFVERLNSSGVTKGP